MESAVQNALVYIGKKRRRVWHASNYIWFVVTLVIVFIASRRL